MSVFLFGVIKIKFLFLIIGCTFCQYYSCFDELSSFFFFFFVLYINSQHFLSPNSQPPFSFSLSLSNPTYIFVLLIFSFKESLAFLIPVQNEKQACNKGTEGVLYSQQSSKALNLLKLYIVFLTLLKPYKYYSNLHSLFMPHYHQFYRINQLIIETS